MSKKNALAGSEFKADADGNGAWTKRDKEEIVHKFTDEELIEHGRNLANAVASLHANEDAAKQDAAKWRGIVKDHEDLVEMYRKFVQDGTETKHVDIEIRYNTPKRGIKTIVRIDTGAELRQVEMDIEELQSPLPFPQPAMEEAAQQDSAEENASEE